MRKIFLHPAVLAALILVACTTEADERVEHVERVFMHDDDEYSFMVQDPETGEMRTRKFHADTVRFIRDVSPDEEMWVHHRNTGGCGKTGSGDNSTLIIHLHGTAEVEGAGWDRGKSGDGRVQSIE